MSASNDLLQGNFASPQSATQPKPTTVASAATIAPTTKLTLVSGTTDVATITPPQDGYHELVLVFTNGSPPDILTTGNVLIGFTTAAQNVPVLLYYEPNQAKYYVKG